MRPDNPSWLFEFQARAKKIQARNLQHKGEQLRITTTSSIWSSMSSEIQEAVMMSQGVTQYYQNTAFRLSCSNRVGCSRIP